MKKRISILVAVSAFMVALTGCTANNLNANTNKNYIGVDEAKNIAFSDMNSNTINQDDINDANMDIGSATFTEAKLDDKNGTAYYDIEFNLNGIEYKYSIDAITGTIIEKGQDGNIVAQNQANNANQSTQSNNGDVIDAEKAKKIALDHAQIKESDVKSIWADVEYEDGVQMYTVMFETAQPYSEYDYEIDAKTGKIISFDQDIEKNYSANDVYQKQSYKSQSEIIKIALAKVPNATEKDIKVELDNDDGKLIYDGKIIYQGMEYDFEIDAYSGAVISWEAESVFD